MSLRSLSELYIACQKAIDSMPVATFFNNLYKGKSTPEAILMCINLHNEAKEQILASSIDKVIKSRHIEKINEYTITFVKFVRCAKMGEFNQQVKSSVTSEMLRVLEDTSQTAGFIEAQPIDRKVIAGTTKELISSVKSAEIPEYAKTALQIQLKSIHIILMDVEIYTDIEIRRRIKEVYADYCAEFSAFDRKHEDLGEKIFRWAKASVGPGIVALGLISDLSTVVPLITERTPKLIGPPDGASGS